jgi:hypothetical protein
MEQILARFQQQFAAAQAVEGRLDEAAAAAVEALVEVLSGLGETQELPLSAGMAVLVGLHAAQETARLSAAEGSRGTGSWAFVHKPVGAAGAVLTLRRAAPAATLDLQLDSGGQPHGMMVLVTEGREDLIALDREGEGWVVRSCKSEPPRTYRLPLPPGAMLAWQTRPARGFWEELMPAGAGGGLTAWAAARKVVATGTSGTAPTAAPVVAVPATPVGPKSAAVPAMAGQVPVTQVPSAYVPQPAGPAAQICAQCRAPLQSGARFCVVCRTPVQAAAVAEGPRFCPACGTPCLPNARFCGHCRNQLRGP